MRSVVIGLMVALIAVGLAFANIPLGDWASTLTRGIDATGGPDAYGYTWIDSNEPSGPVYGWIDISGIGTEVTGLGDDNYQGPFPIGFPFHYYWYDVTQYYVGSNGYLKFGDPFNICQTFPASIPLVAVPNDFLAVYIADWWPGQAGQGHVYRWTNNVDTCIVSFVDISAWSTMGHHNFQVIMTDTDSSITFQYGSQEGTVSNDDILIGIENINGQVGLEHSHDVYAPSNYAVLFEYPDTVTYVVHDMATVASANEASEGFFLLNGTTINPWAKVKNTGNQPETSFQVQCLIEREGGIPSFYQAVTAGPLNPGEELEINFSDTWTPTVNAQYFYQVTVVLTGDMNPNNDVKVTESRILTLPGELLYDDGSSNISWSWMGGTGGLGQRFVPPTYPVRIDQIRFYITSSSSTLPFIARVYDDDGPGGIPGTELFSQNVNALTANQWYDINTTAANIEIDDGAFFVSWHMSGENSPAIGVDSSATQVGSRQSWEETGVWAPYRLAETADVMIRANISEIGAYPDVTIDVEYVSGSPVPVPGGPIVYDVTVTNNELTAQTFDAWIAVTIPTGAEFVLINRQLTMPAGGSASRQLTLNVPGGAPGGAYTMTGYVGDYPDVIWNQDSFPFTKSGDGDGIADPSTWTLSGWDEPWGVALPEKFAVLGNYPNPFNPVTTISYTLPEAGKVSLMVYDLSGRLVSTLVDDYRDAGVQNVTFDASGLASGIYVYRLSANGQTTSAKMVLMK